MDISLVTDEIMNVVTSGSIFTVAGRDDMREQISNILFRENQTIRFPLTDDSTIPLI